MNYRVSAICPNELPSAIPNPLKLPNLSQQPLPSGSSIETHGQRYCLRYCSRVHYTIHATVHVIVHRLGS
jgi:hypothetical protein